MTLLATRLGGRTAPWKARELLDRGGYRLAHSLHAVLGVVRGNNPKHIVDSVLGPVCTVKVAVEAGVQQGWDRYIGPERQVHRHARLQIQRSVQGRVRHIFGITPEAVRR